MGYKTLNSFPKGKCCNLCLKDIIDVIALGNVYQISDVIVHYYCLLLAAQVKQEGKDNQGLLGFFVKDIRAEINRGSRLTCSYCKKNGATAQCCDKNCNLIFHVPCAQSKGSLHQYFKNFQSFCVKHKQHQNIPSELKNKNGLDCLFCSTSISFSKSSQNQPLWPSCCKPEAFIHKRCLQKYATLSGYYFKCPFCSNNKEFNEGMKQCGIYIPEQEAVWETEPNAFRSLLERELSCDAESCICPRGRPYTSGTRNSRWFLESCLFCGTSGMHKGCKTENLIGTNYECNLCKSVDRNMIVGNSRNDNSSPSSPIVIDDVGNNQQPEQEAVVTDDVILLSSDSECDEITIVDLDELEEVPLPCARKVTAQISRKRRLHSVHQQGTIKRRKRQKLAEPVAESSSAMSSDVLEKIMPTSLENMNNHSTRELAHSPNKDADSVPPSNGNINIDEEPSILIERVYTLSESQMNDFNESAHTLPGLIGVNNTQFVDLSSDNEDNNVVLICDSDEESVGSSLFDSAGSTLDLSEIPDSEMYPLIDHFSNDGPSKRKRRKRQSSYFVSKKKKSISNKGKSNKKTSKSFGESELGLLPGTSSERQVHNNVKSNKKLVVEPPITLVSCDNKRITRLSASLNKVLVSSTSKNDDTNNSDHSSLVVIPNESGHSSKLAVSNKTYPSSEIEVAKTLTSGIVGEEGSDGSNIPCNDKVDVNTPQIFDKTPDDSITCKSLRLDKVKYWSNFKIPNDIVDFELPKEYFIDGNYQTPRNILIDEELTRDKPVDSGITENNIEGVIFTKDKATDSEITKDNPVNKGVPKHNDLLEGTESGDSENGIFSENLEQPDSNTSFENNSSGFCALRSLFETSKNKVLSYRDVVSPVIEFLMETPKHYEISNFTEENHVDNNIVKTKSRKSPKKSESNNTSLLKSDDELRNKNEQLKIICSIPLESSKVLSLKEFNRKSSNLKRILKSNFGESNTDEIYEPQLLSKSINVVSQKSETNFEGKILEDQEASGVCDIIASNSQVLPSLLSENTSCPLPPLLIDQAENMAFCTETKNNDQPVIPELHCNIKEKLVPTENDVLSMTYECFGSQSKISMLNLNPEILVDEKKISHEPGKQIDEEPCVLVNATSEKTIQPEITSADDHKQLNNDVFDFVPNLQEDVLNHEQKLFYRTPLFQLSPNSSDLSTDIDKNENIVANSEIKERINKEKLVPTENYVFNMTSECFGSQSKKIMLNLNREMLVDEKKLTHEHGKQIDEPCVLVNATSEKTIQPEITSADDHKQLKNDVLDFFPNIQEDVLSHEQTFFYQTPLSQLSPNSSDLSTTLSIDIDKNESNIANSVIKDNIDPGKKLSYSSLPEDAEGDTTINSKPICDQSELPNWYESCNIKCSTCINSTHLIMQENLKKKCCIKNSKMYKEANICNCSQTDCSSNCLSVSDDMNTSSEKMTTSSSESEQINSSQNLDSVSNSFLCLVNSVDNTHDFLNKKQNLDSEVKGISKENIKTQKNIPDIILSALNKINETISNVDVIPQTSIHSKSLKVIKNENSFKNNDLFITNHDSSQEDKIGNATKNVGLIEPLEQLTIPVLEKTSSPLPCSANSNENASTVLVIGSRDSNPVNIENVIHGINIGPDNKNDDVIESSEQVIVPVLDKTPVFNISETPIQTNNVAKSSILPFCSVSNENVDLSLVIGSNNDDSVNFENVSRDINIGADNKNDDVIESSEQLIVPVLDKMLIFNKSEIPLQMSNAAASSPFPCHTNSEQKNQVDCIIKRYSNFSNRSGNNRLNKGSIDNHVTLKETQILSDTMKTSSFDEVINSSNNSTYKKFQSSNANVNEIFEVRVIYQKVEGKHNRPSLLDKVETFCLLNAQTFRHRLRSYFSDNEKSVLIYTDYSGFRYVRLFVENIPKWINSRVVFEFEGDISSYLKSVIDTHKTVGINQQPQLVVIVSGNQLLPDKDIFYNLKLASKINNIKLVVSTIQFNNSTIQYNKSRIINFNKQLFYYSKRYGYYIWDITKIHFLAESVNR